MVVTHYNLWLYDNIPANSIIVYIFEKKMKITDIHIHIIPGVDDGARNEESVEKMLDIAYTDGIRRMICTPHFHGGYVQTSPDEVVKGLDKVKAIANAKYPDMEFYAGNEIYYFENMTEWLDAGKLLTMAESDYVLVEFSPAVTIREIDSAVRHVLQAGYRPILAHINRYVQLGSVIDAAVIAKKHLKPILVLFAMSVTVTVYVSSDITILGFLCDDYTVGIYSVSTKVYTIVKTVLSSVLVVSIPRLSAMLGKKDKEGFNAVATDIYCTLLTVVVPAIVGMIALRRQIVLLISDVKYSTATSSLAILSIALLFCLGAWFWGQCILVPLKKENEVFKITVVSATANIILNFVMIPLWKENAAALTTVIAEGLSFFWCMYEGKKYTQLAGIKSVLIKVILGCLGIFAVAVALEQMNMGVIAYTISVIILSVIAYFGIEIILKNESVYGLIKGLLKRFKR